MKFYRNLSELKNNLDKLDDNSPVWRGEDGSYAVGHTFSIEDEEGETDYIQDGTVAEWKDHS